MSAKFTVREFSNSDAEATIELWNRMLPSTKPWNDARRDLCRKLNQRDRLVFVGELAGEIVAAVVVGYDGMRGWIHRLAVAKSCQGRGFGRQMLQHAEAILIERGAPKVNLHVRASNEVVCEFYRRCGYLEEDRTSFGKPLPPLDNGVESVPTLRVNDQFHLAPIDAADKPAYLQHLNESPAIQKSTGSIPFPFTDFDADLWINRVATSTVGNDGCCNWAIRNLSQQLIGSIGLMKLKAGEKAEIGYWLAQPYWGQGIMSASVESVCAFAIDHYKLRRIEGQVFAGNQRSANVLTRAGFDREGILRNGFVRDGQAIDVMLFSRLG